jgi:hypothetical protein
MSYSCLLIKTTPLGWRRRGSICIGVVGFKSLQPFKQLRLTILTSHRHACICMAQQKPARLCYLPLSEVVQDVQVACSTLINIPRSPHKAFSRWGRGRGKDRDKQSAIDICRPGSAPALNPLCFPQGAELRWGPNETMSHHETAWHACCKSQFLHRSKFEMPATSALSALHLASSKLVRSSKEDPGGAGLASFVAPTRLGSPECQTDPTKTPKKVQKCEYFVASTRLGSPRAKTPIVYVRHTTGIC